MPNHYVAQSGQELFFFYPHNTSSLHCRIWKEGRLSVEDTLHESIKMPYSVFFQNSQLHVFCHDMHGSTLLFTYRNNRWTSRTVLQGNGAPLLSPLISDDNLCILYDGYNNEEEPCLFKRNLTDTGVWQQAMVIDRYHPFPFSPYVAQATGPGHSILFYQIGLEGSTTDNQVGYREITPGRTGSFHRFLYNQGLLLDASFLTTLDVVHVLMIVKTAFSCQLIYRKKTEDVFIPPVLLWESPKIDQCLLTIVGNELYATCMIGGKLNMAVSIDDGDTFGSMGIYKRKFCVDPIKAVFVSDRMLTMGRTLPGDWFARQIYVDSHAPWDVQMIPDMCPGFYESEPQGSVQLRHLEDSLHAAQLVIEDKDRQIMELMYQRVQEEKD